MISLDFVASSKAIIFGGLMEIVKKTKTYTVIKKRSGRFGVLGANGKWINGNEKIKILLDEGLIKVPAPKAPEASNESGPEDTQETTAQA